MTAKRSSSTALGPSKRRKLGNGPLRKGLKVSSRVKGANREIIPIPGADAVEDSDRDLSGSDVEEWNEYRNAASFLSNLDHRAIGRSKKETLRLHQLNKPRREKFNDDDLPSIDSQSDNWSDEDIDLSDSSTYEASGSFPNDFSEPDSDDEMPYEKISRARPPSWERQHQSQIERLPIKLANGRLQKTGKVENPAKDKQSEDFSEDEIVESGAEEPRREDVSTGARFGRPAVVDVIRIDSRKARIDAAKEQVASICQDIVSDPENSIGLLRRLHSFSLEEIKTPTQDGPVKNDPLIRKLVLLSQLAVFKDIIPGYRIRSLTEKEKTEKVSQQVARTREWEQGLVHQYQKYLQVLESEIKARSEISDVALQCMCALLRDVTHFNFRTNIMSCLVSRLGRRTWDETSQSCLDSFVHVFKEDLTGQSSLEAVRLFNRMIKDRHYKVHPLVLSCLLHLRLRNELDVRASETYVDKELPNHDKKSRKGKGKGSNQPHLSKNAKKAMKENKEIDREFREAEAQVNQEERTVTQTETLKLLFVLYFQIIKSTTTTAMLPAALRGISRFAHLVNVDFFHDLLRALKAIVLRGSGSAVEGKDRSIDDTSLEIHCRVLCIHTAFELLSGQGEALTIDLSDFITALYDIIGPLSLLESVEEPLSSSSDESIAKTLFRCLYFIFSPRSLGPVSSSWRSAAFSKRILGASLHWPTSLALQSLRLVSGLLAKDDKLAAMLSTEDRISNGVYRPDVEDPQLSNPLGSCFWELHSLHWNHCDEKVRVEAGKLLRFER